MKPVLGAIVVSLIVGGCVTKSAMKIGSAQEVPTGYREVQLVGTTLHIHYTTMRRVSGPRLTADDTLDHWSSFSLDSMRWLTLDRLEGMPPRHYVPRECFETRSPAEPATAIMLHEYQGPFNRWYSPDAPDYEAPIAGYIDHGDPRVLVLVRATSSDGQRFVASFHAINSCDYDLRWAPYARVALVPFAVVADIIALPFRALYLAAELVSFLAVGTGH